MESREADIRRLPKLSEIGQYKNFEKRAHSIPPKTAVATVSVPLTPNGVL